MKTISIVPGMHSRYCLLTALDFVIVFTVGGKQQALLARPWTIRENESFHAIDEAVE